VAHASGLFESNLHKVSFVGGFRTLSWTWTNRYVDQSSTKSRRWSAAAAAR
jgi:hypothetical protein